MQLDAVMRRELAVLALALAPVPDVTDQAALILGGLAVPEPVKAREQAEPEILARPVSPAA